MKAWGGGGSGYDTYNPGGGPGGYAQADLVVTTGETLNVQVSTGSVMGNAGVPGGGSANDDDGMGDNGGPGGGTVGLDGVAASSGAYPGSQGLGGTQSAGGAGGVYVATGNVYGTAGTALQGGTGGYNSDGFGGGGGGGYWGGGGGSGTTSGGDRGGGGSGFVTGTNTTLSSSAVGSSLPPNTGDPDYISPRGQANLPDPTYSWYNDGGPGLIVIYY